MDEEIINIPSVMPVFPLPGVVLFPHTLIPLHVFEPRYRALAAHALAGERVLGLALLKPGWEPLYYTLRAPIHPTLGIGQIVESEQMAGGNYNLLLRGIGRATVLEELPDEAYRVARVELQETYCSGDEARWRRLRGELFGAIRQNPGLDQTLRRSWLRLRQLPLDLDELADLLAAALPADAELRQCLLDECDALTRGQMLLQQIRVLAAMARSYRRADDPTDHRLN